jgi:sporulation integral membrane protein YlbJ
MLGAVSIGMLQNPKIAPLILIPHYLSVMVLGFVFSFYNSPNRRFIFKNNKSIFEEIKSSYILWLKTKKSIGSLITKSIKESMDTIILIGGLVIFYSVLVEIIFNMTFFKNFLYYISNILSVDSQIIKGIITGFFEVTIGCKNIAATNTSLINKILIINFLIGWSGLSVHSQSLSFINSTDINGKIYIVSKFFHGILSTIFSYLIYLIGYKNYIQPIFIESKPIFRHLQISDWMNLLKNSSKLAISMGLYILFLSIFVSIIFRFLKNILIRSS